MKINEKIKFEDKILFLERKQEQRDGMAYTLVLYQNNNNTMLRKSPVYIKKPKNNRSISQILVVMLLTVLAVVGAAVAFSFGSDLVQNVIHDVSCDVSQSSIYKTGAQKAYVITSIQNTGSIPGDVTLSIHDDANSPYVQHIGELYEWQITQEKVSFDANITKGKRYMLQVTMTAQDGSVYGCSEAIISK